MRIIGGKLKGKKIVLPVNKSTRPLKDMVRESIFNILEHSNNEFLKINKSKVLDLFSGTGSFGIECISRGSKEVVFFENYSKSLEILKKNIFNLDLNSKSKIIERSAYEIDKINMLKGSYDLIFIDPPFKDKNLNLILKKIKNSKIIHKNTLIIIHRNKKFREFINQDLIISRVKIYGSSKIIFGKLV